jgi:virginiamycin B lyase
MSSCLVLVTSRYRALCAVITVIAALCVGCARHSNAPSVPHVLVERDLDSGTNVAGLAVGPGGEVWLATLNYGNGPSGVVEAPPNGDLRRFPRLESFNRVAVDAHGIAWFTVGAGSSGQQPKLVRLDHTGKMHDYPLPVEGSFQGITIGNDGAPWFVDAAAGSIGRIANGAITYYGPASGDPTEIVTASDGSLWFTQPTSNAIGRLRADGSLSELRVPTSSSRPTGIAAAPDGSIWFCESAADKIGHVTPGGHFSEFLVPTADAWPIGIVATQAGPLWFTELASGKIGRITAAGSISEYRLLGGGYPGPIARAPDGSVWIAVNGKRDATIGLITSRSRLVHFRP